MTLRVAETERICLNCDSLLPLPTGLRGRPVEYCDPCRTEVRRAAQHAYRDQHREAYRDYMREYDARPERRDRWRQGVVGLNAKPTLAHVG